MRLSSFTSSSSEYAHFAWKILVLCALAFVFDRVGGALAEYYYMRTTDGDTGGQLNGLLQAHSDVVVFGSSRAESHYVPDVMKQEIGASFFNAGFKGSNVLYDYGAEQLVFDEYTPKLIIYDFSPLAVSVQKTDSYERLYPLYPYWRNANIWSLISEAGWPRTTYFLSRLYPYNSKIHSIVIFNILEHRPRSSSGYVAQQSTMGNAVLGELPESSGRYDANLAAHMVKFIESAHEHGVKLVVVTSPRYATGKYFIPEPVKAKLAALGVPALDFDIDTYPQFRDHRYFRDPDHLNHEGASLFSHLLGNKLHSLWPEL
ncbi:MAG: hypothetical protein ABW106_02990 [Steroidobacteraceae bacterium]